MSENKYSQSLTTKERVVAGAGVALIGAMLVGGVTSAEGINNVSAIVTSESPAHDQLTSPSTVQLDPIVTKVDSSQVTTSKHAPIFKGKITIKKPATSHSIFSENIVTPMVEQVPGNPIEMLLPTEPIEAPAEKVSLHPELMTVPENVKAIMERDTVYLSSGCSGSIVRSRLGKAIGIVSAEHCGLRGFGEHSNTRIVGDDGQNYIVTGAPVEAKTGPDQSDLKSAGIIKEFLVPSKTDTSQDIAFGAFDSHTSLEVADAYNHNKLSARELSKLKLGDRMYISGWPVNQPENGGNFERQNFPLSYLGDEMVTTSLGETLHMILAAVPTSNDGSVCSFGDSGGKAFVIAGVHSRSVGVLSSFTDFTGKLWGNAKTGALARKYYETKYNVDLSSFDAICGIATETPSINNGGEVINPVSSYSEIPIQHDSIKPELPASAEPLIQAAYNEFFDPTYVKTWVRGAINLDPNGKGNWKMNPVIFYDKASGSAVLASYTDSNKSGLELDYVPDFKDQKFNGYPELSIIGGELEVFTGLFGSNGFVGKAGGAVIGQYLNDPKAIEAVQNDPAFSLYYDDSTQSLQIMRYKHN